MNKVLTNALLILLFAAALSCGGTASPYLYKEPPADDPVVIKVPYSSSVNLAITVTNPDGTTRKLTQNNIDFKPSWSKEGDKITFFRSDRYFGPFNNWKAAIHVVDADGTNLRKLTEGRYADFNPSWTRDGSKKIVFSRYARKGPMHCEVFITSPDANPGDEQLISEPDFPYFEWAMSSLKDGRIFVEKTTPQGTTSWLLTPRAGKKGKYQQLTRPTTKQWHKLSISPDEKKVCYMLDNNNDPSSYEDVVIAYADFDKKALTITNQVIITEYNLSYICEYPRWTPDGKYIVYDSSRSGKYQVYVYRLHDGVTAKLTKDKTVNDMFAHFKGAPK